jgi:hypothetical protein
MRCPNCGVTNSLGASQCGMCATPLGEKTSQSYNVDSDNIPLSGVYRVKSSGTRTRPREAEWN